MKKLLTATVVLALGLGVAACSSSSSSSNSSDTISASADFNDADVMFAQMMIPHHEQAIEMSDIALDPTTGAGEDVLALARQIKDAQDPEIAQMTALLTSWGQPLMMDSSMDHSTMMSGMLSADELNELSSLRGSAFDTAWLLAMIAHHEGALEMAVDVQKSGKNAEVQILAAEIIAGQEAEITFMRTLLS
jgi:uncharacterized protein (DUF305 family)